MELEVEARKLVWNRFPDDAGRELATYIMKLPSPGKIIVDLRRIRPAILVSTFYSGFVQELMKCDRAFDILVSLVFKTDYPFQLNFAEKYVDDSIDAILAKA